MNSIRQSELLAPKLFEEQRQDKEVTNLYASVSSEIIACGFKMTDPL
jgi:hypothetical protein